MSGRKITAPTPRQMDNYSAEIKKKLEDAEKLFFSNGKAFTKDEVISMVSPFGYFKIDRYENSSPADVQYVVFFFNKKTSEITETHGTIARTYINKNRNNNAIDEYSIISDRSAKLNKQDVIGIFSKYALLWQAATNNVTQLNYATFEPADETKLVAYTESYDIATSSLNFLNWKKYIADATYKAYAASRLIRQRGAPNQILLHETAGKSSLAINGARKDGNIYYVPHFCINNVGADQKGNIIQFADVAEQTYHGEILNDGAVGIEFVNSPIEAWQQEEYTDADGKKRYRNKKDTNGKDIPAFKLHEATDGIYLQTGLTSFSKLFIPIEFAAEAAAGYFELEIQYDKVINAAALEKMEIGKDKKKIVTKNGSNLIISFCKSDKFEHLIALISALGVAPVLNINLTDEANWKCCFKKNGKTYFMFNKCYLTKAGETLFAVDIRQKGIYCHGLIGSHADGYLQALYAYLRLFVTLDAEAALKRLIDLLINGTVSSQKLKPVLKSANNVLSEVTDNSEIELNNCLTLA